MLTLSVVADIPAVARLAVRVTCWSATTAAGERLFRDEDLDLVAGQPISALRPFLERTLEVSGFELEIEDDEDPDGGDGGTDPGDGGTDPGN